MPRIKKITAREVLDSRGFPTVEVDLSVEDSKNPGECVTGRASVPSGASTGEGEALELRDGDPKRYLGKGVLKALQHIRDRISPAFVGQDFAHVSLLDDALRELDGTSNKSHLGANAILAVSMAFVRADALSKGVSTRELLATTFETPGRTLPVPLMNILNGGKHADNGLAIQEFMIVPAGFSRFSDALRAGVEVFHHLKQLLHAQNLSTAVGDEGGFAPRLTDTTPHEQAMNLIMCAISNAGYHAGSQIFLALDAAASEFSHSAGIYNFEGKQLSSKQMIELYSNWIEKFPIVSIEDGLSEKDWDGWVHLTEKLNHRCQLVGDDLFVTRSSYLKEGIHKKAANAILIKLNQIGTVTETLETMKLAADSGYSAITSHRSGETEDTFIADLSVATDCGQIKTGSASRTDRTAKYNQLLRLEEQLGENGTYSGLNPYRKFMRLRN